jgi:methionine biosynthesis protein MetW
MDIDLEYASCNICGCDKSYPLMQTKDYRFGILKSFNIVRCARCGLIYTNPRPTRQSITKLYKQYYDSNGGKREKILSFKNFIRSNLILRRLWHSFTGEYLSIILTKARGKVLDIGCGSGNLLKDLQRRNCEVYGVEINPRDVTICKKKGFNVFCGNLRDAQFQTNFFDVIILWHVLEHLDSPKEILQEAFRILRPGGKIFIYTPNAESYLSRLFGKYWIGWHVPFHFYHFTERAIEKLVQLTNFRINKISSITPEYFFIPSLKLFLKDNNKNKILQLFQRHRFFDSLLFRIFLSLAFRILDFILKGKGECLRIQLVKDISKVLD